MRLYIIRHADPDYANHTITPPGHLEARALAERLQGEGIERIYSSPVPRALHTMQYTADLLNMEPSIQPWMAELEGWQIPDADGLNMAAWNVDGEAVREREPFPQRGDWHKFGPFENRDFHIKFNLLKSNSDQFMASLGYAREGGRYRIVQSHQQKIAVFCHLGFGLSWLAHLLELPLPLVWSGLWKAPSSVTTVLLDERSDRWAVPRCIGLGDTSHLHKADLPASRQGIIKNYY
jgi:broad specificity phosphatase PhoE